MLLYEFIIIIVSKEKVKAADCLEFRTPSVKTSSIGVMYTIFIFLLVAICWKPDPKIFIGKNTCIIWKLLMEIIIGSLYSQLCNHLPAH